jgi:hypothetical protein
MNMKYEIQLVFNVLKTEPNKMLFIPVQGTTLSVGDRQPFQV